MIGGGGGGGGGDMQVQMLTSHCAHMSHGAHKHCDRKA